MSSPPLSSPPPSSPNLKPWLITAILCFLISSALVWTSAQHFIQASTINRSAPPDALDNHPQKILAASHRQDGLFWMVASVVACGGGLICLVYFLIKRTPAPPPHIPQKNT